MPRIRKNKLEDKVETKFNITDLDAFKQKTWGCNLNVDGMYDAYLCAPYGASTDRLASQERPYTEVRIRGSSPYRVSTRDYAQYLLEQIERGDAIVRGIRQEYSVYNNSEEVTLTINVRRR